jgi:two-component system, LuxR family, sensor kinase FixL
MPWVEQLSDPPELRRCIRDLVALSTLPAIWKGYDPPQIADSVATALVSMLSADFVSITFSGERDAPTVEVTHVGKGVPSGSAGAIRDALRKVLPARAAEQTLSIANPLGAGTINIAVAPIGFGGDAILAAGSRQRDFPSEVQRLLLGISANDASIALQRWRAEADERRFVSLIERSSDFIGFASLEGRPQYINPAGTTLVGLDSVDQARKLHVLDFLAPQDRARARDEAWPIVTRTGRWIGELAFRHLKTGATTPFLVDWFRIDHPRTGKPINIATVSRDLTAQKRSEAELRRLNETLEHRVSERTAELEQTNEKLTAEMAERERADARLRQSQLELWLATRLTAAGHLAGALAHELNQPLTAIANSVHAARRLLVDGAQDKIAKVPEILAEAAGQALRGGQIIRRLREFITRGETEKRIEGVRALVESACELALTRSNALGVNVQFRFDPAAVDVFANRTQIQQVLVNVIHNAFEAMAGTPRREIIVTTGLLDPGFVEISVADSGPGLAEDVVARLFEPFVSNKHDGMGLGLSIARSIIEAHGGKIRAEPNPEGGAVFRFTLATMNDGTADAD